MPKIPELGLDDISIADEHIGGHDYRRCITGLWNVYNVIKHIIHNCPDSAKLLECLYMIGANSKFEDTDMMSLVYSGKTNKRYKRNMPATKYLFGLEKYGFVFNNLITSKEETLKNKLSVKDIAQFTLSYNEGDFPDVIFGLKLFSDICIMQQGDYFYKGDIRIAFTGAPKLYTPSVDEIFYILPEDQKKVAYEIHNKLMEIGCIRNLEREYMTKYIHPRNKGQVLATIFAAEHLYFLPESDTDQKLSFKFNLRNINKYSDYLSECTKSVQQSIISAEDCGMCNRRCGGVVFTYQGNTYAKCVTHIFRFHDLSEKAVENYIKLLELEENEIKINSTKLN